MPGFDPHKFLLTDFFASEDFRSSAGLHATSGSMVHSEQLVSIDPHCSIGFLPHRPLIGRFLAKVQGVSLIKWPHRSTEYAPWNSTTPHSTKTEKSHRLLQEKDSFALQPILGSLVLKRPRCEEVVSFTSRKFNSATQHSIVGHKFQCKRNAQLVNSILKIL